MPINYLCIDDDNTTAPESLLLQIENKLDKSISLKRVKPKDIASEIDEIKKHAETHKGTFGLILDLRLDRDPNDEGDYAPYRGSTLAQELRTRMAEGDIATPFPIVLWTMDDMFKRSYEQDDTSHDLFDTVYIKDVDITNKPDIVGHELLSLVEGYSLILEACSVQPINLEKLLGIDNESVTYLDSRIDESLRRAGERSTHECARFILNEIILKEGLLIDENVLAARLGVDILNSKENWKQIKETLNSMSFTGAFSSAWQRWWGSKIESWWLGLEEKQVPLKRLGAQERVNILNSKFNLKLVAAEPIDPHYSNRYWTICQILNRPLDSVDGLRASCPDLKPWQNPPYLSVKAVLERQARNKWRINPLESDKLEALKASGNRTNNK